MKHSTAIAFFPREVAKKELIPCGFSFCMQAQGCELHPRYSLVIIEHSLLFLLRLVPQHNELKQFPELSSIRCKNR